eukprot:3406850-Alexandrium_andersonii.AAC.1
MGQVPAGGCWPGRSSNWQSPWAGTDPWARSPQGDVGQRGSSNWQSPWTGSPSRNPELEQSGAWARWDSSAVDPNGTRDCGWGGNSLATEPLDYFVDYRM